MSDEKQVEFLHGLRPAKQVDFYLMALERQHPPNSGLTIALAEQGERILPSLLAHISGSRDRRTKQELLQVILHMGSYHCVTCDAEAVRMLGRELDALEYGPVAKETFFEALKRREARGR